MKYSLRFHQDAWVYCMTTEAVVPG